MDPPHSATARTAPVTRFSLSWFLSASSAVLLTGTVASAGLTYWAVVQTRVWEDRVALARDSHAAHLHLKSDLYRLFKAHADTLLVGDARSGRAAAEAEAGIAEHLARIRAIIDQEIRIDGDRESEELRLLAVLERRIDDIRERYAALLDGAGRGMGGGVSAELVGLLNGDIDMVLADLISVALAGERDEVTEVIAGAEAFQYRLLVIATAILLLVTALTVAIAVMYRRQAARPLENLMQGVSALRQGDYAHAIPAEGATELRALAETLTDMAKGLATRERDLTGQARDLEARVAERTSELQTILIRLERVEASRRQMIADVSHELRTPMTIIQGEADIALRSGAADPDEVIDTFGRIRDAARHSSRIVEDLLLIASEEAGQLRLDLKTVDLDAALTEVAGMTQADVEIVPSRGGMLCRADPLRLRQCLLAIMNNALRYGGRHVRAWVERGAGHLDIHVEDDGPGMTETEKDKAFERFFRGSGALGSGVEGTGLGLPIVRSIMNAHGGQVDLLDAVRGGLVVRLRFPDPDHAPDPEPQNRG